MNQAGRTEKVTLSLPDGVNIEQVHDRSLNELLLAGDLDGIISAREPAGFVVRDPRIARLWPDYRSIEETYYRKTGVFPIMHVIVIRNETLSRHPWIAMNLYRAFDEAKSNSLRRLSSIVNSRIAIPWSHEAYDHAREVLGDNFWPYGIEANRRTLDAFLQYCGEQGVTQRTVTVEELCFLREVSKFFQGLNGSGHWLPRHICQVHQSPHARAWLARVRQDISALLRNHLLGVHVVLDSRLGEFSDIHLTHLRVFILVLDHVATLTSTGVQQMGAASTAQSLHEPPAVAAPVWSDVTSGIAADVEVLVKPPVGGRLWPSALRRRLNSALDQHERGSSRSSPFRSTFFRLGLKYINRFEFRDFSATRQ